MAYDWTQPCKVTLRSHHGKYLRVESEFDIYCNSSSIASKEILHSVPTEQGRVAFKTSTGKWLCAQQPTAHASPFSLNDDQEHETWFKIVDHPMGGFALKSWFNKIVSAQPDGTIDIDRSQLKQWECFDIQIVGDEPETPQAPEPEPEAIAEPEPEPVIEAVEEAVEVEEKVEVVEPEVTHSQPLPDAKPTIVAAADFDDDAAVSAADTLRGAMKGFGTDERDIKKVTVAHSHAQRMAIKHAYYTKYERSLIDDLKSELRGDLEKLCVGFWFDIGQFDAESIHDAMGRLNTDEGALTEIICTRTNEQIAAMKSAWDNKDYDGSLVGAVGEATDGTFGSLLSEVLKGQRPSNGAVDDDKARLDAEELNRMIGSDDEADVKEKLVSVLSSRSWVHIAAMNAQFAEISKKHTLVGAIEEALGDGSDSGKAMRTIVEFASQPFDYWARRLHGALDGLGTNDDKLRRVLICRSEIDLRDIGVVFGQRYGDGRTLNKWIEEEVAGEYGKLCLAVCGF